MPSRDFVDSSGVRWRVWSTIPSARHAMWGAYADGWLTFQAGERTRRLVPVPDGWETASATTLEILCRGAVASPRFGDSLGRGLDAAPSPPELDAR